MFRPKLFTSLKDYSFRQFRSDATAGLIVGVVALPLAIAFAIASGVSPDRGLVTAVVAGFLISALGGSRVQIGGPTGAFVVIVYSIVQTHGVDGLIVATLMGGCILMIFGMMGFGGVLKFIPYPVTVGFTSAIAIIIATTQVKDFLGLPVGSVPANFISQWVIYAKYVSHVSPYALMLGTLTILIVAYWHKISHKLPGSIIALVIVTLLSALFQLPVETIGSRFGSIPQTLPMPHFPHLDFELVRDLVPSAFTIAILAGIESLLSAVVADGMIGGKHRSNTELIAQGIANVASSLFGGMPATGAIARTATNVHNGGRTPVAGIVHALTLVLIMTFFGHWAVHIPLACLAGILMVVSYRMCEWHSFAMVLKAPKSDVIVLLSTFFLTILFDLTLAIEVGVILACFLLIQRLSVAPNIGMITKDIMDKELNGDLMDLKDKNIPESVEVFEIVGAFFFGVASTFTETINSIEKKPRIRILRMRNVLYMDATALNALRHVYRNATKNGIRILISGIHAQPLIALQHSGLYAEIGEENFLANVDHALSFAAGLLESPSVAAGAEAITP
ncbi:MAG: STAS domain-containing protein [Candidatus Omnitrophica bacterium]|nr:STAS domain-containing protein [Candidatus Omnitrophota bacterium]